jgi:hypothetical protein
MNEELEQLLTNLHLKTVAARFDEYLAAADKDGTPFPALLVQLLRAEWQARQESASAAIAPSAAIRRMLPCRSNTSNDWQNAPRTSPA